MAASSTMLPLGTPLPAFSLPDTVSGHMVSSAELGGAPLLLAVLCNHCPYVKHVRAGVAEMGRYCAGQGVRVMGVSSNDVSRFPEDGPEAMKREAEEAGYVFPYLYDESQALARALDAQCTPEFYLFDREGKLAYRGQLDDSRPGNRKPVTGADLRAAIDALLAGQRPSDDQKPSIGCSIKWKSA